MRDPAAEKMLAAAMDRVHCTLMDAENFRKRAPGFVEAWKAQLKATPSVEAERVFKVVAPIIPELLSKSKAVDEDLEKLRDLGSTRAHDYDDGNQFRDRNKKLLESSMAFDREAARVVSSVKALDKVQSPDAEGSNHKWTAPLMGVASFRASMHALHEFTRSWSDLKIALDRI